MVSRRKPRIAKTASSNLGEVTREIFDDKDVLELLRKAIELEGSQLAFAKRHAIDRTYLIYVLQGKRSLSEKFLKVLGLRKVYTAE